ncbi:MAG: bifunctional UDP-N-acetylglucosamine diphosphorylase/glucosamine-1-phosphate N-acetyltransferase GlmU [Pseudomonadota bacterium]
MSAPAPSIAAIILAAGKGTRMKSATPKVLHAVAGVPMVGHVVARALELGAAPIAIVTAPGMDAVVTVARDIAGDVDVAIQKDQLGTAHAVLAARPVLGELEGHLLILYGDTPLLTTATLARVLDALDADPKCGVAVLGFIPDEAGDYGRLVEAEDGTLERIVEAKEASEDELAIPLCNSGVMAIRGSIAWELLTKVDNKNAKGEYYLTDIVALAATLGYFGIAVEGDADEVLGVNSRSELAVAEAIFQYRARKMHMDAGVTLIDPDSVFFAADTIIGSDVIIEPSVFFGPGVTIASGAHIKAFSHIEGATIGANTSVGPFARLRPGATLGADVRVGNFVEIKQSDVADGAKISHLSYIGDASIGASANIGAGTITCNYDGYLKYKTTIGRDVFIGSNSALIAPVTIHDGAMVAAGSTITEDVEKDALAMTRGPQESKPQWAKEFRARKADEKRKKK